MKGPNALVARAEFYAFSCWKSLAGFFLEVKRVSMLTAFQLCIDPGDMWEPWGHELAEALLLVIDTGSISSWGHSCTRPLAFFAHESMIAYPKGSISYALSYHVTGAVKSYMLQEAATQVGIKIAQICLEKGISKVSFDRGGHIYHGRVKVCSCGQCALHAASVATGWT